MFNHKIKVHIQHADGEYLSTIQRKPFVKGRRFVINYGKEVFSLWTGKAEFRTWYYIVVGEVNQ